MYNSIGKRVAARIVKSEGYACAKRERKREEREKRKRGESVCVCGGGVHASLWNTEQVSKL